jgi:hypothetical protein
MWSADKRRTDIPNKKSAFCFLAGIGIGVVIGVWRAIFRTNPKQLEPSRGLSHKRHSKSDSVLTGMASERDGFREVREDGAGCNIEPSPSFSVEPQVGVLRELQTSVPHAEVSPGDSAGEIVLQGEPAARLPDTADSTPEGVQIHLASVGDSSDLQALRVLPSNPETERLHWDTPEEAVVAFGEASIAVAQEESIGDQLKAPDITPDISLPYDHKESDSAIDVESDRPHEVDSTSNRAVEKPSTRPVIHRPKPAESTQEYVSSVASLLPSEYLRWNRWIFEQALAPTRKNQDVYLSITPTILAGIASNYTESPPSPQDAERAFVSAVAAAYGSIIARDGRLRELRACDAEGLPLCLAFLAISVLAAYRMQSDEEASGAAYYLRLAELLACEMVAGHPRGFDPDVFESLWIFVQRWLADKSGDRLAMPSPEGGIRRFVGLPLTHVPLRRLDIEKLSAFFVWAGYTHGVRVPETKLLFDLERWVRSYAVFSSAGVSAVMGERRRAVLVQIGHELGAWDGSVTESSGRRSASVGLMLDIVRYRPDLFYLPRRPVGFPVHFDDGVHVFDAGDDGWYEPLRVPVVDGLELSDGFEWRSEDSVSFRRPPASIVPLGPSPDYTGFLSRSNLLRGTGCAVLCQEAVVQKAADYLRATTGRQCTPVSDPHLPARWRLFANIKPEHRVDIPDGLEALTLASDVDIICVGGLRLGRRSEWLVGAPPKIIVTGLDKNEVAKLDGQVVRIDEDGVLQVNGHLLDPRVHVIDAGGLQRKIEIVEPRIGCRTRLNDLDPDAHYLTLPAGQWYLVGPVPGQATGPIECLRPGRICNTDFDPVWAISFGAGPGANVIAIQRDPQPPRPITDVKVISPPHLQRWADIIYSASIRRPKFVSLLPNSDSRPIEAVWKMYMRSARQIKRQKRRSQ